MMKGLVLVVAAFLAPHATTSGVANEDSIRVEADGTTTNAPSGVSEGSTKKIKMVINTLQDILQSVESEEKQDSTLYQKYTSWCQNQKNDIAKDLADSQKNLGNAKVQSQEQQSSIDNLKFVIARNEKEAIETQDAMDQATALRQDENEKYTDDLQLNTQSLRQINSAIKKVGKLQSQGGFLQNGVMKKLQVNQPGESSYVLGIMKGLKDKMKKGRESIMKIETEKVNMYNSFMKTKSESLKSLKSATTEKKISLSETQAKDAGTTRSIGKLTDEVASLTISGKQTEDMCHQANREWADRQDDRTKEKAAIREAIRYLKETALEQVSLVQQRVRKDETVIFSPSFLQLADESSDSNSDEDTAKESMSNDEVENHMRKGTFDSVKDVVTKLIASHESNQEEETQKREYCKKEIDSTEDEKTQTSDALDATKASINKMQSEADLLADEVKTLYDSIAQSRKSVEEAAQVRKQEASAYHAASKDRSLATKVLMQAKNVLQGFYDKAEGALLQRRDDPPEKWKSTRKTASSYGAVSMIQNIADDIAKEQKDATLREEQAKYDFEKLQQESQSDADKKQQDITDRVTTRAKLKVQINSLKETQTEQSDTLKSLTTQLESLHKQCDELLKNYKNRKDGRAFEVSQLRDVMDVLSGSSIAPRTGLLQESDNQASDDVVDQEAGTDGASDAHNKLDTRQEGHRSEDGSISAHEAALLRTLSP